MFRRARLPATAVGDAGAVPDTPPRPEPARVLGRRELLVGGAAITLAGCTGRANDTSGAGRAEATTAPKAAGTTAARKPPGSSASTASPPPETAAVPGSCQLTPELTAGPYHLDGHLDRRDITEGKPGIPLELRVRVLDLNSCQPLAGAAVDIWHCDAGGEYSGFNGNSLGATQAGGTNDKRYLRGVQRTDTDGTATFTTIFPGWYEGRAVHIHLQVLEGGTLASTYTGGHIAHVGQAFFDEPTTAQVMALDPYRAHTGALTTNDQDSIYGQAGPGAIVTIHQGTTAANGYIADITCVVDPTASPPAAPLF